MNPDLMAMAARVLERALQKSGHLPLRVYDAGELPPPDDALIDGLAGQVLAFMGKLDTVFAAAQERNGPGALLAEAERERMRRLARALGACDCWGESLTCTTCGGRGAPGWRLPERAQFEAVVRPALQKVSRYRLAARNGQSHSPHATRRNNGRHGLG